MQWHSEVKYLIDFPMTYGVGALLFYKKAWDEISPADQKIIHELSDRYIKQSNEKTVAGNQKALDSMKKLGISFVNFPDSDVKKGKEISAKVIEELTGKLFSKDVVMQFKKALSH